jgi:hypothetical protein
MNIILRLVNQLLTMDEVECATYIASIKGVSLLKLCAARLPTSSKKL